MVPHWLSCRGNQLLLEGSCISFSVGPVSDHSSLLMILLLGSIIGLTVIGIEWYNAPL